MADKTALPSVPLLTGENYFNWCVKMESVLQLKRLIRVLTVDRPSGDDKRKEKDEWDEKNADAVACISMSLSDSQVLQFANETNATHLWKAIHDTYAGPAEDRAIDAGEELKNIKMSDSETASEYISRAKGLAVKCASAGLNVSERQIAYNVVRGLHNKFNHIREILKTQREKKLEEILEILKEKERELPKMSHNNGHETAYATRNLRKKNLNKKCFVCGKMNHLAKDCYHRKDKVESRDLPKTYENRGKDKRPSNKYNQPKNVNLVSEDRLDYATFLASNNICLKNQDKWIIDSGCTSHMTFKKDYFLEFKPIKGKVYLAGKNNILESKGIGSLKVKVQNSNGKITYVTVYDVIYVPDLRSNLLSVIKLMERGLKVNFIEHEVKICKENGDEIVIGERIDNHFVMHTVPTITNECNNASIKNNDNIVHNEFSNGIADIWHRRLGHTADKYVQRLKKEGLATGINNEIRNTSCEACKICKLPRKPHKSVLYDQSKEILDLLHLDICGPMPIESIGGSYYILLIVDDHSNMYFTYFLKNKNETLFIFQRFNEKCKNVLGKRVKCIRTDNGTEFINNQFKEFTDKEGIEHQKTIPYNPESNGKVERGNRVILERARTLLYESGLPLSFWAEAVAYVTHTANLVPRKNSNRTPYEIWNRKVPNISYLRIFGCIAYCHIYKAKRNKLQPSGKKTIMLGYAQERVGYRLFDIERGIIIEERNVVFNETQKGSYYLKEHNDDKGYKNWNIESLIDELYDEDPNDGNREKTEEEQGENNTAESNIDNNNIDNTENRVDNLNENENAASSSGSRGIVKRGRPKGITLAESLRRKEEYLREQEDRLQEEGVRRSERLKNMHHAKFIEDVPIPRNFDEARNSNDWEFWKNAMENELTSLEQHNVWDICERPKGTKTVKSKWIFSVKRDENNKFKYKARLVAAGFNQIKNRDYDESYSPVISIEAWRTLIAIAAKKNLNVRFFDVKTAYLHGKLEECVYVEPPPGFDEEFERGSVCKLKKSLYGLPQSGRNWYYRLKEELLKNGLKPLASESCIFINSNEACFFVFSSYVDDFTIIDNDSQVCERIINSLRKEFDIKETTTSKLFLGMLVEYDNTGIYLSQIEYIEKLLNKYGMTECKQVNTPMTVGEDKTCTEDSSEYNANEYQELIGELLYLAGRTRPDIAFATSYLSQYNKCPQTKHYKLVKRILRYLKGSKHKRLCYDRKFGLLKAYSDASWGNADNGKSFSGETIFIGNSLILWKSKKQRTVGNSTCEVELFAVSETVKDLMWLQNMLTELKCTEYIDRPVKIFCDNQATIEWLRNARSSTKTRHVNLKFHFVRDEIESKNIAVLYLNTKEMIADCLTKSMNKEKLEWCCNRMRLE